RGRSLPLTVSSRRRPGHPCWGVSGPLACRGLCHASPRRTIDHMTSTGRLWSDSAAAKTISGKIRRVELRQRETELADDRVTTEYRYEDFFRVRTRRSTRAGCRQLSVPMVPIMYRV